MSINITEIVVRGYHVDLYGHVNNTRYLEFLEEARWQFAEGHLDLGKWQEQGIGFSIVNININYRRPAFMGDILQIRTHLSNLGKTSGTIHHEIVHKGTEDVVMDADVTFVMVDAEKNKPVPIKGELRETFERLGSLEKSSTD